MVSWLDLRGLGLRPAQVVPPAVVIALIAVALKAACAASTHGPGRG